MNFITALLFPNRCLECNTIIEDKAIICEACYDKVDFTHWEALADNPLHRKLSLLFPIETSYALMNFEKEGLSRKIIHQLKYGHRENIGKTLAEWSSERIHLQSKPDLIINVPLHPRKLKKRGYNQLHLFTEALSEAWAIPFSHQYLISTTHRHAQAQKGRTDRLKGENRFHITDPQPGKHFLLIDDVCTTGNTLASCAKKILEMPDTKISILVMAMD